MAGDVSHTSGQVFMTWTLVFSFLLIVWIKP